MQHQLDEEIVLDQFLEDDEICEYNDCELPRTHLLVCPICRAAENLCEKCATHAKTAPKDEPVIFNCSCNHTVLLRQCGKVRLRPPR